MNARTLPEIQAVLNDIFTAYPVPGLDLRVGPSQTSGLELRLDFNGDKSFFPIFWCERWITSDQARRLKTKLPNCILCRSSISDSLAKEYREDFNLNHADCNGRFYLNSGPVLIDRGPRIAAYRNPPQEASPFSLKASRIVRVLLHERDRVWTQQSLQKATGCSPGYVSRVLKDLVQNGQVEKKGCGGPNFPIEYKLLDPHGLLSQWERDDRFHKRVRIHRFSLLEPNPEQIARFVHDSLGDTPHAFTQWYAAWLRHPHTTPPLVSVYVPEESLSWFKPGRQVDTGGNLHLLVSEDEGVFQCLQYVDDFPLVCDAQIYLDLIGMGNRGPEAAKSLRDWEGFCA